MLRQQYEMKDHPQMRRYVVRQCREIARVLESMSRAHDQLHRLTKRIFGIYKLQSTCGILSLYISNIGLMYLIYLYSHTKTSDLKQLNV